MSILNTLRRDFADQTTDLSFKPEWSLALQDYLPLYAKLPRDLQGTLHQKIRQFISTTHFEGAHGLELTNEMILSVSAQACLLVLNHEGDLYPGLHTVMLYPTTFSSTIETLEDDGIFSETTVQCEGESWENGTVLLAWDSVNGGARNMSDGQNVTLHEFAHQLDAQDGDTDGVPLLPGLQAFQTWATVLGEHCSDFLNKVLQGENTLLDPYAATNPGEFFAVATETFFEKPHQLKTLRPSLYAELEAYYKLDPTAWFNL
jgi:Mlc titration factor MtfA (ptsG expression regulator)